MEQATDFEEKRIREHSDSLVSSFKGRSEHADTEYRKSACTRERIRMRDMNRAYETLRKMLPNSSSPGKRMSKIEALRLAIDHIKGLESVLNGASSPTTAKSKVDTEEFNARCDDLYYMRSRHYPYREHHY